MEPIEQIRPMEGRDIEAVYRLEQICFSDPWSRRQVEEGLDSRLDTWFVLEREGEISGYSVLRIIGDEGEIQRIGICPALRRQGMARKLMDQMTEFSRNEGVTALTLEVRESNESARNLYVSCGFCQEAVRKGYYHNPAEDAIIMWNRQI